MAGETKVGGHQLPIDPSYKRGTVARGFLTPMQDRSPQLMRIPSRRVIPIIFIPGIMGSNLRLTAERQREFGSDNNIAWRPDHAGATLSGMNDSPMERQRRLDPMATEVDIYDPAKNSTGNADETADDRNVEVNITGLSGGYAKAKNSPLMREDPYGVKSRRTFAQKARARGWGEVYYGSYKKILSQCEEIMNSSFAYKYLDPWVKEHIVTEEPIEWEAHTSPSLKPLGEAFTRQALTGCFFPVHALGYNWLKSNAESGIVLAGRITSLIERYQSEGFQCEKVILVTHSMGGLVARAVIHPRFGNIENKVLGIVHGAMPAIGAAAAYRRVRCGFEGSGMAAKVLGAYGYNVTPVLGNAQGGLELLPSREYGLHWLQVRRAGVIQLSLPKHGDPYEEIYKVQGKWYSLLREEWLNPANTDGSGFKITCALLDRARDFHHAILTTYHAQSYATYGADPRRKAWRNVVWQVTSPAGAGNVDALTILSDDAQGHLSLRDTALPRPPDGRAGGISAILLDPNDPGDETVPALSADAQLRSGKFQGIFRQSDYEHQSSYKEDKVIRATLYSLIRIASTMKWSEP